MNNLNKFFLILIILLFNENIVKAVWGNPSMRGYYTQFHTNTGIAKPISCDFLNTAMQNIPTLNTSGTTQDFNDSVTNLNNFIANFNSQVSNWQKSIMTDPVVQNGLKTLTDASIDLYKKNSAYKNAKTNFDSVACLGSNPPSDCTTNFNTLLNAQSELWQSIERFMFILYNSQIKDVPAPMIKNVTIGSVTIPTITNYKAVYLSSDYIQEANKQVIEYRYKNCIDQISSITKKLNDLVSQAKSLQTTWLPKQISNQANQYQKISLGVSTATMLISAAIDPEGFAVQTVASMLAKGAKNDPDLIAAQKEEAITSATLENDVENWETDSASDFFKSLGKVAADTGESFIEQIDSTIKGIAGFFSSIF